MRVLGTQLTLILFAVAVAVATLAQTTTNPPFVPTAISQNKNKFFVCGAEMGIASSADGGARWEIRNRTTGGGTLLAIGWASGQLGFAGGTGGSILLSTDAGETWQHIPTSFTDPVLQLSFADAQHGIAVTTAAVLYTSSGGTQWTRVLPSNAQDLQRFRFVLQAVALDATHAAILVKEGPAQYYDGRLVATNDAGKSWKNTEIEHTTLNNILAANGELWLVGTEVIERQNHGGHAVPVTFHSSDAASWSRGPKSPVDTNYACTPAGCLMWNGAIFDPFSERSSIRTFPAIPNLSPQWAATATRVCALTPELNCSDISFAATLPTRGQAAPQLNAIPLRETTPDLEGKCIRCDYPSVLISEKFSGSTVVELSIDARPDGTVSSVEILKEPTSDIGNALARSARWWIFYPVTRNGKATPTHRNLRLHLNVIKPS